MFVSLYICNLQTYCMYGIDVRNSVWLVETSHDIFSDTPMKFDTWPPSSRGEAVRPRCSLSSSNSWFRHIRHYMDTIDRIKSIAFSISVNPTFKKNKVIPSICKKRKRCERKHLSIVWKCITTSDVTLASVYKATLTQASYGISRRYA